MMEMKAGKRKSERVKGETKKAEAGTTSGEFGRKRYTDGRTDGQTDRPTKRGVESRLKIK